MVETTEDYTRLDRSKPVLLDGADRCSTKHECRNQATGFLLSPKGFPGGTCHPCAMECIGEYREKLNEHWTFYEGILYKDPTSSNVLRGFPKEQADAMKHQAGLLSSRSCCRWIIQSVKLKKCIFENEIWNFVYTMRMKRVFKECLTGAGGQGS